MWGAHLPASFSEQIPVGVEPTTSTLWGWRSTAELRNRRRGWIRTSGFLLPKQADYQTFLHADFRMTVVNKAVKIALLFIVHPFVMVIERVLFTLEYLLIHIALDARSSHNSKALTELGAMT